MSLKVTQIRTKMVSVSEVKYVLMVPVNLLFIATVQNYNGLFHFFV